MQNKRKISKGAFLLFFIVGVLLILGGIIPRIVLNSKDAKYKKILESGMETTAQIISEPYSNIEINGVDYYDVDYEFVGVNGEVCRSKTKYGYTLSFFDEKTTIEIRYNDENRSVETTYLGSRSLKFFKLFGFILLCFGILFVLVGGSFLRSAYLVKIIPTKGTATHGYFTRYQIGLTNSTNNRQNVYYKILVGFTDQNGDYVERWTASLYSAEEANNAINKGEGNIYYLGKQVVIDESVFDGASDIVD